MKKSPFSAFTTKFPSKVNTLITEVVLPAAFILQTIALTKIPLLANDDVVLLIDDLVGSGASIHEIAKKIKRINPQVKVIAYGIVGK